MLITLQALEQNLEMVHAQIEEEGCTADLMAQKYELESEIDAVLGGE